MRISLAIPSNRGIRPKTAQCLLELVALGGYEFHIIVAEEGYSVAENRNYIVVQALNNKSDYLLMIDDDMIFPPDILNRLIANDKDICGVAFHPRCENEKMKRFDETHYANLKDNKLFESNAAGTGIILIKCEVFERIPRPWFMFEYYETGQCKIGEDWYFSKKAKELDFKIYIDPTIEVGHIGEKIY